MCVFVCVIYPSNKQVLINLYLGQKKKKPPHPHLMITP